ncbi:hypothetical protein SDC9_164030 [bioreactor metagenome]|uniref:Uncharacterized protein n=1 Tax=bioreactor metagenome TaxID=1076179 RepID=A0A645FQI8_9ZZZZ
MEFTYKLIKNIDGKTFEIEEYIGSAAVALYTGFYNWKTYRFVIYPKKIYRAAYTIGCLSEISKKVVHDRQVTRAVS